MPFTMAAMAVGTTAASTAGAGMVGTSMAWGTAAISAGSLLADAALFAGGASAYSTYQQGQYAEAVGKYNMQVAQAEAASMKIASEEERRDMSIERRKTLAKQLVQFAKGGVVPSAGTPLKIQQETAGEYARDIGKMRYGYELGQSQAMSRGMLERGYGKQRKRASRWMSGSSVLTGAGMALDYRYRYT